MQSNTVAQASARQRAALARNLIDFPPFLRQLGPAMERLGAFAEQTTPVFTDLKVAAPGINQAFTHLAPFSNSSVTYFTSLGKTAKISGPALASVQPLLTRLGALGSAGKPFADRAAELLSSLRNTGGLERLMDFIFLGAGSSNGYDALGHFLRTEGIGTACLTYAVLPTSGCGAKLFSASASTSGTAASAAKAGSAAKASAIPAGTSVVMARTLAVLSGATPAEAIARYPGPTTTTGEGNGGAGTALSSGAGAATTPAPVGGASSGTTYYKPAPEESGAGGMLLNYLLGD